MFRELKIPKLRFSSLFEGFEVKFLTVKGNGLSALKINYFERLNKLLEVSFNFFKTTQGFNERVWLLN